MTCTVLGGTLNPTHPLCGCSAWQYKNNHRTGGTADGREIQAVCWSCWQLWIRHGNEGSDMWWSAGFLGHGLLPGLCWTAYLPLKYFCIVDLLISCCWIETVLMGIEGTILCLKKNRTPITFWNNSNKLCLIIIVISWENHQNVLNIVVCYGLTIFHKTGYQLRLFSWRLVEVWSGLWQTIVDDAIDEWRRRLRAYVRVKGQHFEHLL